MELSSIKETVKSLLDKHPACRDNDNLLILKVWAKQQPQLRSQDFTFVAFGSAFMRGEFASTESIRRVRQKMQEEFPHLRGQKYLARQKHQESIKEELRQPEMKAGGTP